MGNINGSKILIGRAQSGNNLQLAVYKNGKRVYATVPSMPPVPNSVSRLDINNERAHCRLEVDGAGNIVIINMKVTNQTFVDGMQVEQRKINPVSDVRLGMNQYSLDLGTVLSKAEELATKIGGFTGPQLPGPNIGGMQGGGGPKQGARVDIRYLAEVWDDFEEEKAAISKRRKNLGILASVSPIFTIGAGAGTGIAKAMEVDGGVTNGLLGLSVCGLIFMIIVLIMRFTDNSEERMKEAQERFLKSYHCPKCNKFLGNMPYYLVQSSYKKCPGCGAEFIS